jgi:hypothetical protein
MVLMAGYQPLYIKGMQTGLVQSRQNFIIPDDAYPILENAFVWRERIKRKQGYQLLGRLRRVLLGQSLGNSGASPWTFNIYSTLIPPIAGEMNAEIEPGTVFIAIPPVTFTDQGDGNLIGSVPGNSGTVNYSTGLVTLITTMPAGNPSLISFNYFPGLPVMGLRSRELNNINNEQLVAFDQKYAYIFNNGWQEFIPGTTWTGNDSDFFWSTNYWVNASDNRLFWVTNFSGTLGDPIRYTDGTTWTDFSPDLDGVIAPNTNRLQQCLCILPFRGRLVVFNTLEGKTLATSVSFPQRIRWAAIGNPLTATAWRDDIRGQGGFLDIPTSESIISVGFVRDNLVVYCERSTWQLRYTGRSISPFQIEKVNSELGAESTFSAVQFDTSLVGIGDKGIVECDSFKSDRIDIKIPDLVFEFNNDNNGTKRIHGIRDFAQRLAYWTYPYKPLQSQTVPNKFPDRRLVYNYENDSWAIFTDSLTTLGTYQPQVSRTWANTPYSWSTQNYPWIDRPSLFPSIVGGNQQGFVEYLDSQVTNDVSLSIKNITGNTTTPTVITSPNHNLQTDNVIKITNIPTGTSFASSLNNQIFGVVRVDADNFQLWKYNSTTQQFSTPQLDLPGIYIGGGKIAIRDNFSIFSKKFNFLDDGQNIQLGYIDILLDNTEEGAISLNVYVDYDDNTPTNILPENDVDGMNVPDTFFNSVVPTNTTVYRGSSKNWQRVVCPTRGAFITVEWTLSNAQMIGIEQESNVQIDSQILWMRAAGRQLPIGV